MTATPRRTMAALAFFAAACTGPAERPIEPAASSIEVRAAPGARLPDPDWTLHLLREQSDVVAGIFGAKLREPLVLVALPAAEWPRERVGAFQNGHTIYLRDDELHLPWRSYAHEIAHVYEEELPAKLPWFLSEGIAGAIALDVEGRILGHIGPVAEKERALDQLLVVGDATFDPRACPGAENPVLQFTSEPSDDAARASAYAWATALVRADAIRGGEGYFRRLHVSLAARPAGRLTSDAALLLLAASADAQVAPLSRR